MSGGLRPADRVTRAGKLGAVRSSVFGPIAMRFRPGNLCREAENRQLNGSEDGSGAPGFPNLASARFPSSFRENNGHSLRLGTDRLRC
jgi:hypothetical protein